MTPEVLELIRKQGHLITGRKPVVRTFRETKRLEKSVFISAESLYAQGWCHGVTKGACRETAKALDDALYRLRMPVRVEYVPGLDGFRLTKVEKTEWEGTNDKVRYYISEVREVTRDEWLEHHKGRVS